MKTLAIIQDGRLVGAAMAPTDVPVGRLYRLASIDLDGRRVAWLSAPERMGHVSRPTPLPPAKPVHTVSARHRADATASYAPLCACGRPASATVTLGSLRVSVCATCYHGANSGTSELTPAQIASMRIRLRERANAISEARYWADIDRERFRNRLQPIGAALFPNAPLPGRVTLDDVKRIASYSK